MKYAFLGSDRAEATPQAKALCMYCGKPMIAKCGTRVVWHWAHKGRLYCDSWWENETDWHRSWKNAFPESWQEVVHEDSATGERHIADVKTPTGLIVEFQHSNISQEEKSQRDAFYKSIIWIVDVSHWKKGLWLGAPLPPPNSEIAKRVFFEPPCPGPGASAEERRWIPSTFIRFNRRQRWFGLTVCPAVGNIRLPNTIYFPPDVGIDLSDIRHDLGQAGIKLWYLDASGAPRFIEGQLNEYAFEESTVETKQGPVRLPGGTSSYRTSLWGMYVRRLIPLSQVRLYVVPEWIRRVEFGHRAALKTRYPVAFRLPSYGGAPYA